ncbi:FBP domain-containing protein [Actinomadura hibisca]|uniref:FBP domain-containing protein n=1 Tax=Actinomadura hibisca TaxID=68565 RepID=UPI00082F2C6A|nr:FBP domain-containing protein [Actinomadura hibisca]
MRPVTESDIRASFVNCTKGEAKRMAVPKDLAERPWDDLDFLGWRDPAAPERAYMVLESGEGLTGVALRLAVPNAGHFRKSMCSLCLTTHTGGGVSLMTARRAGRNGQDGNTVGAYFCADLACSLYLRGKKRAGLGGRMHESLSLEELIARTEVNLAEFVGRVVG